MSGRSRAFSGLTGSISTDFMDGINDRGAYAGQALENGFDYNYRYGYPITHDAIHYTTHPYHTIFYNHPTIKIIHYPIN